MGLVYQALFIVFSFLLAVSAQAELIQQEIKHNVVITRDLSVSGEKICHDGRSIYYKSEKDCSADSPNSNCQDLKIAPIYQIERIILADELFVTQFYKVDLSYRHNVYVVDDAGQIIEKNEAHNSVQFCKNRPRLRQQNVLSERWATQEEYPYLYGLLKNDMSVINSPMGEVRSLMTVNLENHNSDKLSVFSKINIKSPYCEENPIFIEYVMKLGGEYSGNGWRQANVEYLQSSSGEIKFLGSVKDLHDLDRILKAKIYCVKTVEI